MTIAATPPPNAGIPPQVLMRRWTVDEYHTLIRSGVFARDERFELLEGWLVAKMSRNPPHDAAMDQAREELEKRLRPGWRVRVQSAITTADSEPEPDLAVVQGTARSYSAKHPEPADIAIVIEVAESSLTEDRRDKGRIYARAGIALYWIVNLVDMQLEVYSDPTGPAAAPQYRKREDFVIGQSVPLAIDGHDLATVPVSDLLP
jgi:Uma2 family endonuclease